MDTAIEVIDFSPKDRMLIGTLFARENPSAAGNYLSSYNSAKQKALDSDQHNLNFYFLMFCRLQNIDPWDYLGKLSKRDKVDKRRLFIGSMVRVYKPQFFCYDVVADVGIGNHLCIVLQMDNGNMTRAMDETKHWYNEDFEGFQTEVDTLVERLIDAKNGFGYGSLFNQKVA